MIRPDRSLIAPVSIGLATYEAIAQMGDLPTLSTLSTYPGLRVPRSVREIAGWGVILWVVWLIAHMIDERMRTRGLR